MATGYGHSAPTAHIVMAIDERGFSVSTDGAPPVLVPADGPQDDLGPHVPALREVLDAARVRAEERAADGAPVEYALRASADTRWSVVNLATMSATIARLWTPQFILRDRATDVALRMPPPRREHPNYRDEPTCEQRAGGARLLPRSPAEQAAGGAEPREMEFEIDGARTIHASVEGCALAQDCRGWARGAEHFAIPRNGHVDLAAMSTCIAAARVAMPELRVGSLVAAGWLPYGEVMPALERLSSNFAEAGFGCTSTARSRAERDALARAQDAREVQGPDGQRTLVLDAPPGVPHAPSAPGAPGTPSAR